MTRPPLLGRVGGSRGVWGMPETQDPPILSGAVRASGRVPTLPGASSNPASGRVCRGSRRKGGEIVEGEGVSRVRLEDFDERQSRLNDVLNAEISDSENLQRCREVMRKDG